MPFVFFVFLFCSLGVNSLTTMWLRNRNRESEQSKHMIGFFLSFWRHNHGKATAPDCVWSRSLSRGSHKTHRRSPSLMRDHTPASHSIHTSTRCTVTHTACVLNTQITLILALAPCAVLLQDRLRLQMISNPFCNLTFLSFLLTNCNLIVVLFDRKKSLFCTILGTT